MPSYLGKVRKKKGLEIQAEGYDTQYLPFGKVLKLLIITDTLETYPVPDKGAKRSNIFIIIM